MLLFNFISCLKNTKTELNLEIISNKYKFKKKKEKANAIYNNM